MYQFPKKHGDTEIERAQNWLEKNFDQQVTLDHLTDVSNLGKKTLMRRFKQATGETPLNYLKKIRLENAKRCWNLKNYHLMKSPGKLDTMMSVLFTSSSNWRPGSHRITTGQNFH
jgi:AraC-like DNA-binding protein